MSLPTCSAARPGRCGHALPAWICWCSTRRICSHAPGNPYLGPDGRDWPDNGDPLRRPGRGGRGDGRGAGPGLPFDIVHAHDWQAAMAAVYLHFHHGARPGTVLTVHNLAFQGRFPRQPVPAARAAGAAFTLEGWSITARQLPERRPGLRRPDHHGLAHLCRGRSPRSRTAWDWTACCAPGPDVLSGILNGIDETVWNPATDPLIPRNSPAASWQARQRTRRALQTRHGSGTDPDALLIGVVSRLTWQKGLDMLLDQLDELAGRGHAARRCSARATRRWSRLSSRRRRCIPAGRLRDRLRRNARAPDPGRQPTRCWCRRASSPAG